MFQLSLYHSLDNMYGVLSEVLQTYAGKKLREAVTTVLTVGT